MFETKISESLDSSIDIWQIDCWRLNGQTFELLVLQLHFGLFLEGISETIYNLAADLWCLQMHYSE